MTLPKIIINADEINCLIYSYLQDSGFVHTAFSLKAEGVLESSPHFAKHIPRGELIDLLCKSLLYVEVESHWKSGEAMNNSCKAGFSLMEPHVCSTVEKPKVIPSPQLYPESKLNGTAVDTVKRKASSTPSTDDGPTEKRARTEPEDMYANNVTSTSETAKPKTKEPKPAHGSVPTAIVPADIPKKTRRHTRLRGPADGTTDPEAMRLLQGHQTEVFVCAWNPARPGIIASGSKDAVVHIWNIPGPPKDGSGFAPPQTEPPLTLNFLNEAKADQSDLTSLDWNADGSLLAIGSYDSVLRISTVEGDLYFSNPQHQGPIFATRFSKSGRWLLTASLDGTACVWDVKDKKLHMQYRSHTDCCLDVEWLDESTFATCGADALIHITKINSASPIKTLCGHENEINQIKCNPSRTRMASCSDDQTARIWNVANVSCANPPEAIPGLVASDQIIILKGHNHVVSSVAWCPLLTRESNEIVATSSFDGTTRLWDSITGECFQIFTDHKRPVYALSFSPDGHWLATGSGDGWLHIYNVEAKDKRWSWFAGPEKRGVFEIDWQKTGNINRIALALECRQVGIVDVTRIAALQLT